MTETLRDDPIRAQRQGDCATHPCAMRVFQGYRRPDLSPDQFLRDVGQTFMPGTPYMLAPLGCAAYLPGVVVPEDPLLPHEFALIAYPSQEIWKQASIATLRGRIYTQTHAGVYDKRSRATFPVMLGAAGEPAPEAYFAFDRVSDWQSGTTFVLLATVPAPKFVKRPEAKLIPALTRAAPELARAGVDQLIVLCGPSFVISWVHLLTSEPTPAALVGSVIDSCANLQVTIEARPIPVADEPPSLELEETAAFNYLFIRDRGVFP